MSGDPEPTHEDQLNDRQRAFLQHVASGMPAQRAARNAGYSPASARKASGLLKVPAIARGIAEIRAQARVVAAYDLAAAMKEAESAQAFARVNKNSMALVKATELRAKLSGLLIDRVEVATVDLTGALKQAEHRVLQVLQASQVLVGAPRTATKGNGSANDPRE